MKSKYLVKILLAIFFVFASTQSFAKVIKWSMQGDKPKPKELSDDQQLIINSLASFTID